MPAPTAHTSQHDPLTELRRVIQRRLEDDQKISALAETKHVLETEEARLLQNSLMDDEKSIQRISLLQTKLRILPNERSRLENLRAEHLREELEVATGTLRIFIGRAQALYEKRLRETLVIVGPLSWRTNSSTLRRALLKESSSTLRWFWAAAATMTVRIRL